MRIGDLDALYDCVEARYRLSSGEEHKVERALFDAICEMPPIDAIPVEWLRGLKEKLYGNSNGLAYRMLLDVILNMWQKEQEAR